MYELHREIVLSGGSASHFYQNVSTYYNASVSRSYAAVGHRYQVNFVSWDSRLDGFTYDSIQCKEPAYGAPCVVTQAKYVSVNSRALPLLVVCAVDGYMVFELDNANPLTWQPVPAREDDRQKYAKGIASVGHYVVIGDHTGALHVLSIGENAVRVKPQLKQHTAAIVAVGQDVEHLVTASDDGIILAWDAALKVLNRISTGQSLSVVTCLRNMVVAANVLGQLSVYSLLDGLLLAEVGAHARIVTDLSVAPDAKLLLSTSEDSFVRVWKIEPKTNENKHVDAATVSCAYSECVPNAPLVGGCFNDSKGSSFCVTAYDFASVFYFKRLS